MSVDGAIYSAVLVSMGAALVAVGIGAWVVWRIYRTKLTPRPIAGLLLLVILAMAFAQLLEQSRVLVFRLSYDGFITPGLFRDLYTNTWNVVSSKLLMSAAIAAGSMLQLALYCRRTEWEARLFVYFGWVGTLMTWLAITLLLEAWL